MKFSRWVFLVAGVYGLIILPPHYFLFDQIGRVHPPAITHPEYFYGFLGVAIAWQVAFVIISVDPPRYRPLFPAAILEKVSFGVATIVLFAQDRIAEGMLAGGIIDLAFAVLFGVAYWRSGKVADQQLA